MRALLRELLRGLGRDADEVGLARLDTHAGLIAEWNRSAGLVSRRDATGDGLVRHYAESIRVLPWLAGRRRAVDIGSGGGFPILVWAALVPDLAAVAVESNRRKAAFLRQAAHEMGLPQVEVLDRHLDRPEDLAALDGDVLSGRAAGCSDLLLEAGRRRNGTRVILFPGITEASWLRACPPADFVVTHHEEDAPPDGGTPRALVVLDREVPRGTCGTGDAMDGRDESA